MLAGVGKSHLGALFVAQELLQGFDILFECIEADDGPANRHRHFYWITSSGQLLPP